MRKNSFNKNEHDAGLVDKYINTAYDKVVIVSDNIEDVKKAAVLVSNPEDFAKLMENVDDLVLLVNIQEELITVAAASDQVVLVGNSIDNVIAVSTNLDVINVVGDNILALQNIDANMVSITTVDAHIAEITSVFNDLANIDTVALNIDHVNTVAANVDAIVTAATEVITKHAEVVAAAAQVALDKESVDASQIAVASDAAAVEQHATDVELWAGQVEESKGVVTTLEELARRWAVGIRGSGVDEPTDQNNAYWYATKAEESATEARNNANQTFKSGGYFQPQVLTEYPNVVGVVVDTIWLIKFTNDTDSYVMTTGELAGITLKNGYMLVYDTPSNTFDYIPTTLTGASSVNHQSPDANGNIQLSAEDFTDIYSKTESNAITDALALTNQQQGTAITELESSMTEAQNSIGSLETGLQTTNTTVTELTTEVGKKADSSSVSDLTNEVAKKANSTEVVKLSGVGGGVDVPKWANDAARPDTTDVTKAILGYNTERGEYEAFNPELNEWGAVGGGSGLTPPHIVTVDTVCEIGEAYLADMANKDYLKLTLPETANHGDVITTGDYFNGASILTPIEVFCAGKLENKLGNSRLITKSNQIITWMYQDFNDDGSGIGWKAYEASDVESKDQELVAVPILPWLARNQAKGDFSCPKGYKWSDFERIDWYMGVTTSNSSFGESHIDKIQLDAFPSNWECLHSFTNSNGTIFGCGITAKSDTTASWGTLSGGTVYPIAMVGYTKRYASTNNSAVIQLTPDNTTGGVFSNDNIAYNQRYELDIASVLGADWVGAQGLEVVAEIYNGTGSGIAGWGESGDWSDTTTVNPKNRSYRTKASVLGDKIVVQTGNNGLTTTSNLTGNPFGIASVITEALCRIRVNKGDQIATRLVGHGGAGKTVLYESGGIEDGDAILSDDFNNYDMLKLTFHLNRGIYAFTGMCEPDDFVGTDVTSFGHIVDSTAAGGYVRTRNNLTGGNVLHIESNTWNGITSAELVKVVGINYA